MLTALRRGSAAVGGQKNPKTKICTDRTRPLGTKGTQGPLFIVLYALYSVGGLLSDWQTQPAGTVVSLPRPWNTPAFLQTHQVAGGATIELQQLMHCKLLHVFKLRDQSLGALLAYF